MRDLTPAQPCPSVFYALETVIFVRSFAQPKGDCVLPRQTHPNPEQPRSNTEQEFRRCRRIQPRDLSGFLPCTLTLKRRFSCNRSASRHAIQTVVFTPDLWRI
jgi:hypothetical protein